MNKINVRFICEYIRKKMQTEARVNKPSNGTLYGIKVYIHERKKEMSMKPEANEQD